ncbi:MAG: lactate racemase domain-containing protein [Desulfuromonadales bacterium]|nr:lactate racemase domain-containing protein [Desulfuromonadales bacterium]
MKYLLSQNALHTNDPVEVSLPDTWDVAYHGMKGDELSALTRGQIKKRLNTPYGLPPLKDLARGKDQVAIVFDDNSRGTPTQIMAEVVLEELLAAGIVKRNIRFLCALGTHAAQNRLDFVAKLGEEIVSEYLVFNHNCYENNVQIGVTKRGFPVCINAELMKCDLKIGLGGIVPHPFNGFGGGGKLLFPGMASIETVEQNHKTAIDALSASGKNPLTALGDLSNDGMRLEVEEMTRMVGGFFKLDALYNTRLELVDLYCGDPIEAYYEGVKAAQKVYAAEAMPEKDIVIVNANAKANEAALALFCGAMQVKKTGGGDLVLVNHARGGQIAHYLLGAFGKTTGGRMWSKMPTELPFLDRIIYFTPYPDLASCMWFGEHEKVVFAKNWGEVMELLKQRHSDHATVGIMADGTIQYTPEA